MSIEEVRSMPVSKRPQSYWWDTTEGRDLIKKTYAPANCTDLQFQLFVDLCKDFNLDPKKKEVHLELRNVKDKGIVPIFIIHRDGYLSIAKRHPDYLGLNGDCVYSNDTFKVVTAKGETIVEHSYSNANRGTLVGAWAIARRKGCDDMYKFSFFESYKKANNSNTNYSTYPDEMILKVAHSYVLRLQFEIFGFDSEETVDSYTQPVQQVQKKDPPKKIVKPKQEETIALEMLSEPKADLIEKPKTVITIDAAPVKEVPKLEPEYKKVGDQYVKITKEDPKNEPVPEPPSPKKDTPESLKEDFFKAMENGYTGNFNEFKKSKLNK